MYETTVRAVHRVELPVHTCGEIIGELLDVPYRPFPPGAVVVLDVGDGRWMRESEIRRMCPALIGASHVTVTGTALPGPQGNRRHFEIVYGLDAIARCLDDHLARMTRPSESYEQYGDVA